MEKVLELKNIVKRYGQVPVLKGVDFDLYAGEVHAIVGQNGAGKSTLMKILAGVITDYEGIEVLKGKPVRFRSAGEAQAHGIGMVHQELSVILKLSVAENLFIGTPGGKKTFVNWWEMENKARQLLKDFGLERINVKRPLGSYLLGIQQMIEIIRTIHSGAKIIIMDEPTSALSPPEVKRLFELISRLKQAGTSIIFISHFLDDVLDIADRITVLRDGRKITTLENKEINKAELIRLMLGSSEGINENTEIELSASEKEPILEIKDLSCRRLFRDVAFSVGKGEVVGLFGYMGAGHMELPRVLFGLEVPEKGRVILQGKEVKIKSPGHARSLGLAYAPESRKKALCLTKPIYANITLPFLATIGRFVNNRTRELEISRQLIERTALRPPKPLLNVGNLSGGNQQKVSVSRWLPTHPIVFILSEPTRGMDIGAKEEIINLVRDLKAQGMGIIVASSEPETIFALADRILVFSKGKIVHEFKQGKVNKELLFQYA